MILSNTRAFVLSEVAAVNDNNSGGGILILTSRGGCDWEEVGEDATTDATSNVGSEGRTGEIEADSTRVGVSSGKVDSSTRESGHAGGNIDI